MFRNHLLIAIRNIIRHKLYSFINTAGLAAGMAVAILIGLWIWDEASFNKQNKNYDRIAQVMQNQTLSGNIATSTAIPAPLGVELQKNFSSDFKYVVMSSWTGDHIGSVGDKKVMCRGAFMDKDAPSLLDLKILDGSSAGLDDPTTLLLSESQAVAFFGTPRAAGKILRLDNQADFKVAGVYEDIPLNSTFRELSLIASWNYFSHNILSPEALNNWNDNSFQAYVQLADHVDLEKLSARIKDLKLSRLKEAEAGSKPALFLQPMSKWHLHAEFKDGVNTGGRIQYLWLFGGIGFFVLLLACINFINLSTARSEKQAKEVGVRKAVGSLRTQLLHRFYTESFLNAFIAFLLSLVMAELLLPLFNEISGKQMAILWRSPVFWVLCMLFTAFTAIIAGTYPAFYLSSFNPVKVLKGSFKAGPAAALPRRVLVVVQFAVSVILVIGTLVILEQVQYAKQRPVGYGREGLVTIALVTDELSQRFNPFRQDLLASGMVTEAAESSSSATGVENNRSDVSWEGKDPSMAVDFANVRVTTGFGKTLGWQITKGRDFSPEIISDSLALIVNETAVKYMGLKDPLGKTVRVGKKERQIIGVVKDMLMSSPYEPVKQTIFYLNPDGFSYISLRVNSSASMHAALSKIESLAKNYAPSSPFAYKFADEEYARKFREEERIGKLAGSFAVLAILISCLGLFGMASFMAEQRKKEIGIRKILGASVLNLWGLLSKEFVALVLISFCIAGPAAWLFMHRWLQQYTYRIQLPLWIFITAGAGALFITICTVSYQSIRAAVSNPVKSLRTE